MAEYLLRADPAFAEKPFDGIADLLYDLSRTSNIVLGIATGHTSSAVRPALDALGWRNFFRTIQAADMAPSKPHPGMLLQALQATGTKADDAVFIGDTSVYRKPHPIVMPRWNRLSWRDDRAVPLRSVRPGLAIEVEVAA